MCVGGILFITLLNHIINMSVKQGAEGLYTNLIVLTITARTSTVKLKQYICNITTYNSNENCMIGTLSSNDFGKSILSCSESYSADGTWF